MIAMPSHMYANSLLSSYVIAWSSSRSGSVKHYSSEAEMLRITLEENQERCEFFKHFKYDQSEKLGTVSLTGDELSRVRTDARKV